MNQRQDEIYMDRALELAEKAIHNVFPNPRVGAVIIAEGEVVGEGYHGRRGGPHAEREAIAEAGGRAKGGTLYLNLEPCCHHGETPPCTEAIINAGISRVVFAIVDPDSRVCGRGAEILRSNGIEVISGIRAGRAFELNYPFIFRKKTGRTLITLKIAVTIDGKLEVGDKSWFTSGESRKKVHFLRAYHEAVATGIGTVLSDDPALDRRFFDCDAVPPVRIVLDSSLRFSPESRWLEGGGRVLVYCRPGRDGEKALRLEKAGAEVTAIPENSGGLDLKEWRDDLGRKGITSVLVEGGAGIATSLMKEGLADILHLFIAPRIAGTIPPSWYSEDQEPDLVRRGGFQLYRLRRSGNDISAVYHGPEVREHFAELGKD